MSRHRLSPHVNLPGSAALPQLGDVFALIDRADAPGGHWYWLGDFTEGREATMPWRLPDGVLAHLVVPRLLLQLQDNFPRGAGVLNHCGVVSCVNPAHWDVETRQQRGRQKQAVVLTDFHGKGWTNSTRVESCPICRQPPNRPCDPVPHDAEFRRLAAADATACQTCHAAPYQDCNTDVHRLVFQHQMRKLQKKEPGE